MSRNIFIIFVCFILSGCLHTGGTSNTNSEQQNQLVGPHGNGSGYGGAIRLTTASETTYMGKAGTLISLTGSDFESRMKILINRTIECTNIQVLSPTQATCWVETDLPRVDWVTATNLRFFGENESVSLAVDLGAPPRMSKLQEQLSSKNISINYNKGNARGGDFIIVEGSELHPTEVLFDTVKADFTAVSDTELVVITPAHSAGDSQLIIKNNEFQTAIGRFTFITPEHPNSSRPLATALAPVRMSHSALWRGDELFLWGGTIPGSLLTRLPGARYNLSTDSWSEVALPDSLDSLYSQVILSGENAFVYGGTSGGPSGISGNSAKYTFRTNTWTPLPPSVPRQRPVMTVAGPDKIIVWGGSDGTKPLLSGQIYNFSTNTWTTMSAVNCPSWNGGRLYEWTGKELMVLSGSTFVDGSLYNPVTGVWRNFKNDSIAIGVSAVIGKEIIIFGRARRTSGFETVAVAFNPTSLTWRNLNMENAPEYDAYTTAAGAGGRFYVYKNSATIEPGGSTRSGRIWTYDFLSDKWSMSQEIATEHYRFSTLTWAPPHLILYGGIDSTGRALNTGILYTPE